MPKRRRAKSRDRRQIETDFFEAIDRLKDGKPQNQRLRKRLDVGKDVRINFTNVADEADRSRTLIATEDSHYPRVRERIRLESGQDTEHPQTLDATVRKLRRDIADLRAQLKSAINEQAAAISERDDAVKKQRREESARKRAERERDQLQQKIDAATDTTGTVVPLKRENDGSK